MQMLLWIQHIFKKILSKSQKVLFINILNIKNVTVGEMVTMPSGKVFNFADSEGTYFAVMEKNQ